MGSLLTDQARTVLETTSDGVFILDRDWRFTYLNAAAERFLGRGPGELPGLNIWDEFPLAVEQKFGSEYHRAVRTGVAVTFDESYAPLDTTFEVRAFPDHNGLVVFFRDVNDDRRLRRQQEAHAQLTRAILDSLPAHTAVLDSGGTITSTNMPWDAFGAAAGLDAASWSTGVNYLQVCQRAADAGDRDAAAVIMGLKEVAGGARASFSYDYECSTPDAERWFAVHAVPLLDHEGVIVSHTDITSRVLSERRLRHQAHHDDLTGLPNRRRLLQILAEAMTGQDDATGVAVLLVDLDGFKNVNDSLGHDVGDALLRDVATRLSAVACESDVVARVGGDEFVLVAPDCDGDAATALADRIRASLAKPFDIASMHLPTAASIGIALSRVTGGRPEDLLRDADVAMYTAKARGRDRSQVFSPALGESAHDRLALAAGLRMAVTRGELFLHYQPIICLDSGAVCEVEALMRWNHPERGLLFPGSFIELAEETGVIVPISRWLLAEALRQVAQWSRQGLEVAVAVNIAAQHLSLGTLFDDVSEALGVAQVRPEQLIIELTETDVARDPERSAAQLCALRELGVRVAMDDFGSGYSSLGQLASLPVDVIKIDRSLVKDLGTISAATDVARTIISAVTQIADSLGMATVAEGIETAEQRAAVTELGCTNAQGFLFARPMTAHDLVTSLPLTGTSPSAHAAGGPSC
ncbi:hypothetical protein ASD06_12465 [Angustibacter sp. Root456]|nr:hypothetical protein ASD06_12465 [Angustibacter sp. Root456]